MDARSDIFSFGSLLYEMVTGRCAFGRDSAASTSAAILKENPRPANEIVEDVPAEVAELIERCLRKTPADRFQTTAEVVSALKTLMVTARPKSGRTRRWGMFAAAAAVLLAIAVMLTWRFGPRLTRDSTSSASPVPVPLTSYPGSELSPSFSPDGNQVAFSWVPDEPGLPSGVSGRGIPSRFRGNLDIYLKQIGSDEPVRLTRDPAADWLPAWSPDGRYIAFVRELAPGRWGLFLVPPIGGRERKVSEVEGRSFAWFPDCKWLVVRNKLSPDEPPALFLLSLETGEKQRLTSPPQSSLGDSFPAVSPGGRALVFSRSGSSSEVSDFYYLDLSKDLRPSGAPKRLTFMNAFAYGAAWTPDGKAVVVSAGGKFNQQLWRITQPGATAQTTRKERLAFAGDGAYTPAISRQGRMSYAHFLLDADVWRLELRGGRPLDKPPSRLISSTRVDHDARYSPDGRRIAFASNRTASHEIWVCDSDGANAIQLTSFAGPYYTAEPRWSPDGRFIAFSSQKEEKRAVFIISSEGGQSKRLEIDNFLGWSRDGRWIYFRSNRNAGDQLWKMPSGGGAAIQVTQKGCSGWALESRDGKFVYYLKEDPERGMSRLWKVSVQSGEETQVLPSIANYNFAVVTNGIYFVSEADLLSIQFLNFASRSISTVAKTPREPSYGFSVSPDERSLIFTQFEDRGSDLMLVENFR